MIYMDELNDKGWRLGPSCHMFTDPTDDLSELHAIAEQIGLRRTWFQHKPGKLPHYDLVKSRMDKALKLGAVIVSRRQMVDTMDAWRAFQINQLKNEVSRE